MLASFDKDRLRRAVGAAAIAACCALPRAAFAADPAGAAAPAIDADKFFSAIVKVQTRALPDARSAGTLGTEREGTGIVIDENGLILTIGYLIV
ncbi:MAG: hypothetical protein ACREYB_01645, partial [Casimicrobiaceae bacterium]